MLNHGASSPVSIHRDILVLGGSSGSLEALKTIVRDLPADLPASIFIVSHISPEHKSYLPDILQRECKLPVAHATDGAAIRRGRIYVAPPDHHLIIEEGYLRLWRGPKENHSRPSINPLFRSAATVYGERVIGVILSGHLDDGTAGLIAVKLNHGIAVVQDPKDALHADMPRNAMRYIEVDYAVPYARIAALLTELVNETVIKSETIPGDAQVATASSRVQQEIAEIEAGEKTNGLTMIVCPDCGGPLWEFRHGEFKHFRCRVGHIFSPENMLANHAEVLERALWVAVRTLEERASLTREMANVARHTSSPHVTGKFESEAAEAARNAEIIRQMLLNGDALPD